MTDGYMGAHPSPNKKKAANTKIRDGAEKKSRRLKAITASPSLIMPLSEMAIVKKPLSARPNVIPRKKRPAYLAAEDPSKPRAMTR